MIPPLKVLSKEDEATAEFVVETGLSKGQLQGDEQVPIHPGSGRKLFVLGQPLMWPELLQMLPTRMCELHEWYIKSSSVGNIMFAARIQDKHFHQGMDDVWIEFTSLWFLYHQDALDNPSLMYLLCKLSFLYSSSTTYVFSHPFFYLYHVG